jgi:DNA-binding transcriptional regulator YiaG
MKVAGITFTIRDVPAALRNGGVCLDQHTVETLWLLVANELAELGAASGESLKFLRKAAKLKATDLATLLGVTPETVSHWETAKRGVPIAAWTFLATVIAEKLGVAPRVVERADAAARGSRRKRAVLAYPSARKKAA